jgi:hypothetical protein
MQNSSYALIKGLRMTHNNIIISDENHIITERREKLAKLKESNSAYPNSFVPDDYALNLHDAYDSYSHDELLAKALTTHYGKSIFCYNPRWTIPYTSLY